MQMIFQDPYSSLNPRMTLLEIVGEPLLVNDIARGKELEARVGRPAQARRPAARVHASAIRTLSAAGERQRIGIARALATHPRLVVADEPVSALDVSMQAQTLNLLQDLQAELHLTYLFVSHDLGVVEHICDRVAVMYVGKLVEMAETEELYLNPKHPYTEALLSAVPQPDPDLKTERIVLQGEVPDPGNPPSGCYFHPRCRYAIERCKVEAPVLEEVGAGHFASCHRAHELQLGGMPA